MIGICDRADSVQTRHLSLDNRKMAGEQNAVKILGVIADFTRDAENDYKATRCNVFGLNHEEYTVLSEVAKITPKVYTYELCDRVTVWCSPWRAMRILGENFGYTFTVTPISGPIAGPTGERRTEVWTMVSSKKTKVNQV